MILAKPLTTHATSRSLPPPSSHLLEDILLPEQLLPVSVRIAVLCDGVRLAADVLLVDGEEDHVLDQRCDVPEEEEEEGGREVVSN